MGKIYKEDIIDIILKLLKGTQTLIVVGSVSYLAIKGIAILGSNKDKIDTEKHFNYIIDYNGEGTSIVKMNEYTDYNGQTIKFKTQDNLRVYTGLSKAEIVKADSYESAYEIALKLTGGIDENITSYDMKQGLDISTEDINDKNVFVEWLTGWTKKYINLDYDYDYAITETPNGVVVDSIETYKTWNEDDKVQYIDSEGIVYLGSFDDISLLYSKESSPESVYQYALSLAGSEDRLSGDIDKENGRVLHK